MSLPSQTDIDGLDYVYQGLPFSQVEAKSSQNTNSLDFVYLGLPFVGAVVAGSAPVFDTSRMFLIF